MKYGFYKRDIIFTLILFLTTISNVNAQVKKDSVISAKDIIIERENAKKSPPNMVKPRKKALKNSNNPAGYIDTHCLKNRKHIGCMLFKRKKNPK